MIWAVHDTGGLREDEDLERLATLRGGRAGGAREGEHDDAGEGQRAGDHEVLQEGHRRPPFDATMG